MSKANKRERQRLNREARREYEEALSKRRRRVKTLKGFAIVAVPVIAIGVVLSITNSSSSDDDEPTSSAPQYATLTTSLGDIVVELDPTEAPESEAQFVKLAKQGFYDGLTFHRVSTSTGIIQSGDPTGSGSGGSGTEVDDELPTSAYKLGDFAFANAGPNTSDSQFFIVTGEPGTQLPLSYNRFGHVIRGLDIAQQIEALSPPEGDGAPTTPVTLEKVTISKKAPPEAPNVSTTPSS